MDPRCPGREVRPVYNARNRPTDVSIRTTGGTVRYDAAYHYNHSTPWDHARRPL